MSIAPGKIILTGEYVGIFGEPVTLTAVGLETRVRILPVKDPILQIDSTIFPNISAVYTYPQISQLWHDVQAAYTIYLTHGDAQVLRSFRRKALLPASIALASSLSEMGLLNGPEGMHITLESNLPVGSGLGSSASMSAAIVGGVHKFYGIELTGAQVNTMTYHIEQLLNGKPSGADNSAVTYGGWLRFQRGIGSDFQISAIGHHTLEDGWWLVDTGKPDETTLDMISMVLANKEKYPDKFERLILRDREITEKTQKHLLQSGTFPAEYLNESQHVLEEMGVIGENGKTIIRALWKSNARAKISGAGGIKSGVGTALVYQPDADSLKALANDFGFKYRQIVLGVNGWHLK
jgi:mevalonate kinase